VVDLVSKIRHLPPGSQLERAELGDLADWGHLPENVARLVDLMTAWLNYEYASWTADPDEVASARKRKRKPPPFPIIPPVAARPRSLHEQLAEHHAAIVAEHDVDPTSPRMVSDEEFDELLDKWM
jgi:hypothetical protein